MRESQFGFSYEWRDLKPIRATTLLVIGAQIAGGLISVVLKLAEPLLFGVWIGAALLTFPAYIAGIAWQAMRSQEPLKPHRRMILRLGGISLVLSVVAVLLLLKEPRSRFHEPSDESAHLILSSAEIRAAAGLASYQECSFGRIGRKSKAVIYRCRVPENSRDMIRSTLVLAAWEPMPVPSNALVAFRKNGQVALFVCKWKVDYCELWLQRESQAEPQTL